MEHRIQVSHGLDVFSKYGWIEPLKDNKATEAFKRLFEEGR